MISPKHPEIAYLKFEISDTKTKCDRGFCRNRISLEQLVLTLCCHYLGLLVNIVHKEILAPLGSVLGVMTEQHVIEAEPEQLLRGQQRHACLLGRAVALTLVTLDARRHEVLRRALAALRTRKNMIERQVLGVLVLCAILAAITVADVDARTLHRGLAIIAADVHIVTQPNHGRHGKRGRRRMQHIVAVIFLNKNGTAKPQAHRARHAHRAERLVREI